MPKGIQLRSCYSVKDARLNALQASKKTTETLVVDKAADLTD